MNTEICPSNHALQIVLAVMKPLGVILRPTFTEAASCGLNIVRSLFRSILGSHLVILWVALKSSPSRCHIVSPHAHQPSHAITSTPPPPDLSENSVSPAASPTTVARTLSDTYGRSQDAEDCPLWDLTKEHKVWRPHKNKGVWFPVCSETANVSSHYKEAGLVLSRLLAHMKSKWNLSCHCDWKLDFCIFEVHFYTSVHADNTHMLNIFVICDHFPQMWIILFWNCSLVSDLNSKKFKSTVNNTL